MRWRTPARKRRRKNRDEPRARFRLDRDGFSGFLCGIIGSAWLQIFRLGIVLAIAWLIRDGHLRHRVQGGAPITAAEARVFLPETHRLAPDPGPRAGLRIFDRSGREIGYAVRTMPQSRAVTGYSGPLDALIVLDAEDRVKGVAIRHSYDTPSHVRDVAKDYLFMEIWNGRTWEEVAAIDDLAAAGIYGVSGATRTSECLAHSIGVRFRGVSGGVAAPFRWGWRDTVLAFFALGGCAFAFAKDARLQRLRPWFSLACFLGLGLWLGDLLALSLLAGWAESGTPWRQTPGLVLMAAAAFLVPWATRQPVYCQHLCPHGHAQRWLMKLTPARWMARFDDRAKPWPRLIPFWLLFLALAGVLLRLPLDLAGFEPFDAYLIRSAGAATLAVAAAGLLLSAFVPMGYCKYGCPTGLLLDFARRRTRDRLGRRDLAALGMLAAAFCLHRFHDSIHAWMVSP